MQKRRHRVPSARSRLYAVALLVVALTSSLGLPALAAPGYLVDIPIDTLIVGDDDEFFLLATSPVPAEFQGQTCVTISTNNNSSVHPGNDLIVASGGTESRISDVEAVAGLHIVNGVGNITLGTEITVTLDMGPDEWFSAGLVVTVECEGDEEPPSGYACVDGSVVFIPDTTGFEGTVYETEAEAAADPNCVETPPSGYACVDGSVVFIPDTTGFEGTVYETEEEAAANCEPTITVETLGVCVNDAPWLYYTVSLSGDVDPGSDTVDIRWFSAGGVEGNDPTHNYLGLPLTGNLTGSTLNADGSVAETITNANRVPWPGLRLASDGVTPVDWPGWVFQAGEWLQQDDGFSWARQPGAFVELTVNPTGTDVLAYPPSTPTCSANPPDEVESEVIDTVDDVDELPLTGLEYDAMAIIGATLLLAGASLVFMYGKREES